jgi:hypothetical protein
VLINRRSFLCSLAAAAPAMSLGRALAQPVGLDILLLAQAELRRVGHMIPLHDVVGVADFARPSSEPRLHLVDIRTGAFNSVLVAHGRGSDPDHSGWLKTFSNEMNSNCSSRGAFLTADHYLGKHGRSMRIIGLDPSNSNAGARNIVVHSADYVSPAVVREHGVLGRSEGCFAVDQADLSTVLTRLGPGRLLVSTKL